MTEDKRNRLSVIVNAILTAISTIIGALFMGSCIGLI